MTETTCRFHRSQLLYFTPAASVWSLRTHLDCLASTHWLSSLNRSLGWCWMRAFHCLMHWLLWLRCPLICASTRATSWSSLEYSGPSCYRKLHYLHPTLHSRYLDSFDHCSVHTNSLRSHLPHSLRSEQRVYWCLCSYLVDNYPLKYLCKLYIMN